MNTATGAGTLLLNNGDNNTATGALALLSNTTGFYNTADGAFALLSNTEGSGNTGSGYQALYSNQTGANNAAFGYTSLYYNTGSFNTAFGSQTLVYNTEGERNTATGYQALAFNQQATRTRPADTIPFARIQVASRTLPLVIRHSPRTQPGTITSRSVSAPDSTSQRAMTTFRIGHSGFNAQSNTIRIGTFGLHTSTYIAGITGQTVGTGGTTCYVDNNGKLGVSLSARRFKTDIADMDNASEALLALRPVTFHYNPELDKTWHPAVRPYRGGGGEGKSRPRRP